MTRLRNTHPGEILKQEFLDPMGVSAYRLAKATGLPQTRISDIVHERRRITVDSALRFAKFFGTTGRFWMGLQDDYDLEKQEQNIRRDLESIVGVK